MTGKRKYFVAATFPFDDNVRVMEKKILRECDSLYTSIKCDARNGIRFLFS